MPHAYAAEVRSIDVHRKSGSIYVSSDITIDAPMPAVYEALLDYDKFAELSDSFTESRYIDPAPDGSPRIYTRIEGCIWFFCKKINRYARLELEPKRRVTSIAEPEISDADYSVEVWDLSDEGGATRIIYTHELKPGFWVPPLIGVMMIRRTLKKSSLEAAVRIEDLANASLADEVGGSDDDSQE